VNGRFQNTERYQKLRKYIKIKELFVVHAPSIYV
jgi:hypothetical protein